jgi:transcriptional regulator with XRE-family HTH domain
VNRFKQLRYERGLTQQQVANGSGVSLSTIIRLERTDGKPLKPGAATVKRLAGFYGLKVTDLVPIREAA